MTNQTTSEWPGESEWVMVPSTQEVERERRYWASVERIAEYEAWYVMQAEEWDEADEYEPAEVA